MLPPKQIDLVNLSPHTKRELGNSIVRILSYATRWLDLNSSNINSLNVFPVPDGDTGTNMLFTMRAAIKEGKECQDSDPLQLTKAIAYGAFMGARGNSGTILSLMLRGMVDCISESQILDGKVFARSLKAASKMAYKGVADPVEGTMLTVIKDAARAGEQAASAINDFEEIFNEVVKEARASVSRTTQLLPILEDAGVVDAGGQGLLVILEGALKGLTGEPLEPPPITPNSDAISKLSIAQGTIASEQIFGNCTEFIISGPNLDAISIKNAIGLIGQSTVVVEDVSAVRIHTHSFEPEKIIQAGKSFGQVSSIKIQDMDKQHFSMVQSSARNKPNSIGTIAVAPGIGIGEVFSELGIAIVVPGGQTMNPSIKQLLDAIESIESESIILVPNNKNIILTAQQAAKASKKRVEIVPTTSIPQGVASILAFNLESGLNDNLEQMKNAMGEISALEITRSVRSTTINGMNIKKGEYIALLDGQLLSTASEISELIYELGSGFTQTGFELATIYYGIEVDKFEIQALVKALENTLPKIEIELINGGQPHYQFIISLE